VLAAPQAVRLHDRLGQPQLAPAPGGFFGLDRRDQAGMFAGVFVDAWLGVHERYIDW
jgi:hypothetical protein